MSMFAAKNVMGYIQHNFLLVCLMWSLCVCGARNLQTQGFAQLCKDFTTELHLQSFSQESALDLVTHFLTMNWLWKYLRFCFIAFSGPASHSLRETKKKVTHATTTYKACPGFTVTWGFRPWSHFDSSLWDTLSPKTQLNYDCTPETQN